MHCATIHVFATMSVKNAILKEVFYMLKFDPADDEKPETGDDVEATTTADVAAEDAA